MKSYVILILLLLKVYLFSKILTFPFKYKISISNSIFYNSSTFLKEYLKKDLIIELNIGSPPKKISSILNSDSACFKFPLSEENIQNNYYPNESSTFELKKKDNNFLYYEDAEDIFYFGNNNNESHKLSFAIEQSNKIFMNNKSFTPEIGLNIPMAIGINVFRCPYFLYDLYNKNIIHKRIFSIRFSNKYDGQLIIGDDLTVYDPARFKGKYFFKYFYFKFSFNYDSFFIKSSFNKIEYMNFTNENRNDFNAEININSGVIIGTKDFKNFIHKNFFEYLVQKKICEIELVKYDNNEYYVYMCYGLKITGQSNQRHPGINYYEEFPNIYFNSKQFEYNFELTKRDLFELVYDKYYFLIIFRKNYEEKEKNTWQLGKPFFKKYPFTINLDAKTIGFYLDKIEDINNNNDNDNDDLNKTKNDIINTKEKDQNLKNKSKIKDIFFKIGQFLIVIVLLFGAYYIGIKVKEGRKKRANELNDDSYEYISDNKKDINEEQNNEKNKQFVELNSRLAV